MGRFLQTNTCGERGLLASLLRSKGNRIALTVNSRFLTGARPGP